MLVIIELYCFRSFSASHVARERRGKFNI